MSPTPPAAASEARDAASPLWRALGILIMVVPTAGLLLHLAFYALLEAEAMKGYVYGPWMKAAAVLALINLVANWFHYRKTRMRLDIASRVLTYLWVISMILLLKATAPAL